LLDAPHLILSPLILKRWIRQLQIARFFTIAYSYKGDAVLAVATRPDYVQRKCGFEVSGGRDVPRHLALLTPEGTNDITRSRYWYDINEDGVHKYRIENLSVGTISNFVSASEDFSFSNFVAWRKHGH
jgi:hypothetical protein